MQNIKNKCIKWEILIIIAFLFANILQWDTIKKSYKEIV